MLPHYLLNSTAYESLSLCARGVLVELLKRYDGANNGRLALSARDAANACNCSKDRAAKALLELRIKGFIELVKYSSFSVKQHLASEYRVTLHRCDVTGNLSSKNFMRWQPESPSENDGARVGPLGRTAANMKIKSTVSVERPTVRCEGQSPSVNGQKPR